MSKIQRWVVDDVGQVAARWCACAAFGLAVVPEVCSANSMCSAFHRLRPGSRVDSPSTRSCHQWSRPLVERHLAAGAAKRRRSCSTVGASSIAPSAVCLQRDPAALAPGLVLGDQHAWPGAGQPLAQRLGREAAEHDHVRRADAGAGQHRDRQLRDHAHVDPDHVALADAELAQRAGEPAHLVLELGVGDRPVLLVHRLRHEVVGDLVAVAGLDVPVEAVGRDVQLAVGEPGAVRRVPHQRLGWAACPSRATRGRSQPEALQVAARPPRRPTRRAMIACAVNSGGRREGPPLLQQDVDRRRHRAHGGHGS